MAKPHNTIPPHAAERPHLFWRNVEIGSPDECWNWRGHITQFGYGVVIRQINMRRIKLAAHRLAYYLHRGGDPSELCICHDVRQIRASYTGKRGDGRALARRFNVNFRTISLIVNNKIWTHITE